MSSRFVAKSMNANSASIQEPILPHPRSAEYGRARKKQFPTSLFVCSLAAAVALVVVDASASVVVVRDTPWAMDDALVAFYQALPGTTASKVPTVNSGDLAGATLFVAVLPASDFTSAELIALSGFLRSGGRIAFMGDYQTDIDTRINTALAALGSTLRIDSYTVDLGSQIALRSHGDILDHPLTEGVNVFQYGAANRVSSVSGEGDPLFLSQNHLTVFARYQTFGGGSLLVMGDSTPAYYPNNVDNPVFFENLLQTQTVPRVVRIDVRPGNSQNPINPKSHGSFLVAILSEPDFLAPSEIDLDSITFGHSGFENSLLRASAKDVDHDGLVDLVCHFSTQAAGFQAGDTVALMRGHSRGGTILLGSDHVRILH
jgi:hypothetical protein